MTEGAVRRRSSKAPRHGVGPRRPSEGRAARLQRAALFVISPDGHLDDGALQSALALLRSEAPVLWVEPPAMRPFWLVTRHADVVAAESRGAPFIAAPRSVLSSDAGEAAMR